MKNIIILILSTTLCLSCSSITVLRTSELNRVRDEIDSSNTVKVNGLLTQIDSLNTTILAMQNAMVKFTENTKNLMRNDRISLNTSLDRLDKQLSYFEAKLEASEHQLNNINTKMGSLENKNISIFEKTKSDSLNEANIKSKELYELAYKDYLSQKYEMALSEFKELCGKYPQSVYVDKSLYYTGLISQVLNQNDSAIVYYDRLIVEYPNVAYVRSAYVKKGDILVAQNKKEEAKKVYEEIIAKYPQSPETEMVKDKLKALK